MPTHAAHGKLINKPCTSNDAERGGFGDYVLLKEYLTMRIPDHFAFPTT